jgi:microcin C transport system ATP-binding protein
MSLLEVRDLTVEFGTKRVVDRVSFSLDADEKFALVGESGSGKTVTALSLLRLIEAARVSGEILFDGEDVLKMPEAALRDLRGRDIAMIFQEPMTALNPIFTIGKQIVESIQLHEKLAADAATARAVELLRRTGVPEPERRFHSYPHQLSGGQRQRAMIAMALACRPRLLIADEPTTALDVTIQAQILDLLAELQREFGMAVILITHDLNLVKRFAQRVGVMQAGKLVETGPTATIFSAPQHEYTRLLLASRPERMAVPLPENPARLLEVEKLNCVYPIKRGWFGHDDFYAVRDASLELKRGETLGIVGESGSGKTTLGLAVLRLQQASGTISFDGIRLDGLPQRAVRPLRKRMQVVFQDPFSSLSPRRTIEQIVGEGLELHFPELGAEGRRRQVIAAHEEVGMEASMLGRYPQEFSGGQRQRIAVARVVVLKPDFLVLDEPTSSLDATVQRQVLALLIELQQRLGMSYLFISHDLGVIRAVAHRVVVMKDGRIVESGDTGTILSNPEHPYTRELLAAAAV